MLCMGYSQNGGNQMLLVLATDSGGELLWTGSTHAVIVTRDGRIVRTVGLGHDLANLTTRSAAVPPPGAAVQGPFSTTRLEDFPELGLYGAQLSCRTHLVGRQKIDILGQALTTNRVMMKCAKATNPTGPFQTVIGLTQIPRSSGAHASTSIPKAESLISRYFDHPVKRETDVSRIVSISGICIRTRGS